MLNICQKKIFLSGNTENVKVKLFIYTIILGLNRNQENRIEVKINKIKKIKEKEN